MRQENPNFYVWKSNDGNHTLCVRRPSCPWDKTVADYGTLGRRIARWKRTPARIRAWLKLDK